MIIGLDLDSTLIHAQEKLDDIAAKQLGITQYERKDYHMSGYTELHRSLIEQMFEDPKYMGLQNQKPHERAYETLRKWKNQKHELHIITARDYSLNKCTRELVAAFFPGVIDSVILAPGHHAKLPVMQQLNLDCWVDDSPSGVAQSTSLGITTFLIVNEYTMDYNARTILQFPVTPVYDISCISLNQGKGHQES